MHGGGWSTTVASMPDIVPDDELAVVVNSTGKQAGGTSVYAVEVELDEWTVAGWCSCRITSAVTRAIVSGHISSLTDLGVCTTRRC